MPCLIVWAARPKALTCLWLQSLNKELEFVVVVRGEQRFRVEQRRLRGDEHYHRVIPAAIEDQDGEELALSDEVHEVLLEAEEAFRDLHSFLSYNQASLGTATNQVLYELEELSAMLAYGHSDWIWQVLDRLMLSDEQRLDLLPGTSVVASHLRRELIDRA